MASGFGAIVEQGAVEGAVLDGFKEVRGFDAVGVGEVGDGAGDLEDAVALPAGNFRSVIMVFSISKSLFFRKLTRM